MTLAGSSRLPVCDQYRGTAHAPILFPGAGHLAFPACLLGLGRCTPDLRGLPGLRSRRMIAHPRSTLSPSPRLQRRGRFVRFVRFIHPAVYLSIHCTPGSPPNFLSCGFPKNAPPLTSATRVRSRLPRGVVFGRVLPNTQHLPPMSFLPTSTACSASCPAGLLHPAASHGVRAVSAAASLLLCLHNCRSSTPFPGSLLTPSKAFPFLEAASRHRDRCHLVVAPLTVSDLQFSTSWPCSSRKSVAGLLGFPRAPARYFLGLCSPSRRSPRDRCPLDSPGASPP
jgi:hypothetical protein